MIPERKERRIARDSEGTKLKAIKIRSSHIFLGNSKITQCQPSINLLLQHLPPQPCTFTSLISDSRAPLRIFARKRTCSRVCLFCPTLMCAKFAIPESSVKRLTQTICTHFVFTLFYLPLKSERKSANSKINSDFTERRPRCCAIYPDNDIFLVNKN